MSESNVKIVRSLYDAFARRDRPAIVQSLDPKVEVQQTEMRYTGFEGRRSFLGKLLEHPDLQGRQFLHAGDSVVAIGRIRQEKAFRKLRDAKASLLSPILLRQRC